ncbi:M4 family metallopeptidase [Massilia sp. R2A-15]|uniref:M4 family metallopeptidase n=1 Tax=Massilia sp. R2A-15 TaxID=3064278 RepID=UPI0027358952|nr:M4 family metallopeptidase [Massilia sp. R2A-15]WLI89148.1 M4 family metallopeptidase [Massilia sp. R2A-15]
MNLRKNLIAASLAVIPFLASGVADAADPVMAGPLAATPSAHASLLARMRGANDKRGLDPDHGFAVAAEHPGVAGTRVTRLYHTYKGVRVFESESVLVTNDAGKIVSESRSDRSAGLGAGSASFAMGGRYASFSVQPSIAPSAAIAAAEGGIKVDARYAARSTAELIVYPIVAQVRVASAANKLESELNAMDLQDKVTGYELAWLVKTRMVVGGERPVYVDAIVSAVDGRVIKQWQALQTVVGTGNSQYNGTVPISTTLSGSVYSMKDPLRGTGGTFGANAITNANHTSSAGAIYTNSSNTWGDGQQYIPGGSTINANGQTAAVNALWGLMNTYDMLKNTLGWQSLDGNNTATYIAAHVNTAYENAYYDDTCRCMYIGDGGSSFNSLGSLDVIGHEMSHGVTAATSNLTYSGESGGLNESNSDIGGEAVEAYARAGGTGATIPNSGNDWLVGKEIAKNGVPLRWMYKPSKDGASPDAWSASIGRLDVHYSSGPNNRMFYFLSQGSSSVASSDYYSIYLNKSPLAMTGIGTDKAYRIWFKALTTKFTASTNYADARNKVLQSAQELYGVGSREAVAVQRAYAAINVGADVDETGGGGGGVLAIATNPANVTVAPGATASFAVGASGGTTPYKYQWLRNGASIAGATSASYSFTAQAADNGARFSARVTDSAAAPASVTSSAATLTVASGTATERIVNGSFESGTTGWAGNTGVIGSYAGQAPYDGTRFAWLGGNGYSARETITQTVAIPASAVAANLSFALHIDTAENTSSVAYDKLVVTVKNPAGTVLGTLATYSNLNKAAGYQIRNFNLLAWKGQTIVLSFAMTEDFSLQTSFVVDKVSLVTQ